jgi:hypothetical protein
MPDLTPAARLSIINLKTNDSRYGTPDSEVRTGIGPLLLHASGFWGATSVHSDLQIFPE